MDYQHRLEKVKQQLKNLSLDGVLITSVPNITYLTGFSSFSQEEREAYLIITNHNNFLITDGRYITAVKNFIRNFLFFEITTNNPLEGILKDIKQTEKINTIGFEEDNISFKEYKVIN